MMVNINKTLDHNRIKCIKIKCVSQSPQKCGPRAVKACVLKKCVLRVLKNCVSQKPSENVLQFSIFAMFNAAKHISPELMRPYTFLQS